MAEFCQPSDPDPEFPEFEDYGRGRGSSQAWDHGDLFPVQGAFDFIGPPSPTQASELVDDPVGWKAYAHPQITTHSAPQLYSPRETNNPYIRPYHSGPMALSRKFAGFDTSGISSSNEPQSMLPMNMNLNPPVPRASAQIPDPSSQSEVSRASMHRLNEPKDLPQYDNSHSREVTQCSQMSHTRGQNVYSSSPSRPRKRPRGQNLDDWSILDGDNGTGQMFAFNVAVQKISLEDEANAIDLIKKWLEKYSAKDPPNSNDINALATLTRLPVSEVNRLLVQVLWKRSNPPEPSTEAALPHEGNVNATNPIQQQPTLQSSLLPPIFERAVRSLRSRPKKCPPKQYKNLPGRDPTRIYQCTLGCNQAFERKADWIRHEIDCNYQQEGWLCNIQTTSTVNGASICSYCHVKDPSMDHATNDHIGHPFCHTRSLKALIFVRKDKFVKHCNKFHPSLDSTEQADRAHFWVHSEFPSYCGFCDEMADYSTCYDRFEHIAEHFEAGKDMRTWKQSHSQASEDDDSDGDGDDDDNNDDQNNSDENGEQNGGNLGDEDPQYYPPFSNYHSRDSGYNSKGSGQSSSNNTGASFGSRHNTDLVADVNFPPLTVDQASQEKHSHSSLKVDKMIGTQHQPFEEPSILRKEQHSFDWSCVDVVGSPMLTRLFAALAIELSDDIPSLDLDSNSLQEVSGPKLVVSSTKPLPKYVMREDVKKPYKDLCIEDTTALEGSRRLAHPPRHSQMRGNLQKSKDIVFFKFTLPGGRKTASIKNKTGQPSSITLRYKFPSGLICDHRSLFRPGSSVVLSATMVAASLEQELSRALIIQSNRKLFLPISALDALVTEDVIERELRGTIPGFALGRPHLPSQIARRARKLFAILTYLEKGSLITAFLDEHITDSDLPLEVPLALVGQENQGMLSKKAQAMLSKVFANRPLRDINDFCRVQWYFLAPIFDRLHAHYELDDNVVLPFIKNEKNFARQGGCSEVWQVKIHRAHHQLRTSLVVGKEPPFAIKRLFSRYPAEFEREAEMLKVVSKLKHRHLLELLMTYKLKGRYHLVFPYAKYNLRQFWNSVPIVDNAETVAWSLQQMRGIASGLEQIHCFTLSSVKSSLSPILAPGRSSLIVERDDDQRYGRHGDIKPENILWFADGEWEEDREQGHLVIADFGLGRFHRLESRSIVDPANIGGTATYAPPEVQLGSSISRAYDIWSLACVYLEFVTWLVGGWQDLNTFGDARVERVSCSLEDDSFYTVVYDNPWQPEAIIRQGVQTWIKYLHQKPNCSAFIHEFLDLISERMLRVQPTERIKCQELNWKLSQMLERAKTDPNYLVNSKAEALSRPKDETQQQDASSRHCTDLVKYNPIYGYTSASDMPLWILGITCERDCSFVSKNFCKLGRASYEMAP